MSAWRPVLLIATSSACCACPALRAADVAAVAHALEAAQRGQAPLMHPQDVWARHPTLRVCMLDLHDAQISAATRGHGIYGLGTLHDKVCML